MDIGEITEQLGKKAEVLGAYKAAVINASEVVTDASFRDICEKNSCGLFGACWVCPPECGEISVLMAKLKEYRYVFLYQTVAALEDSFDFEGMQDAKRTHSKLSQALGNALPEILGTGYLHLGVGGCGICEKCTKPEGLPCRFPDKALPSMEAYGIDVYRTVRNTELRYINGKNTVTYFGAVFF